VAKRRVPRLDYSTVASDPGGVQIADARLKRLCPDLFGAGRLKTEHRQYREYLARHMALGDSRAAVVVALDPILVAAYTSELDCVAVLAFPSQVVDQPLVVGTRLLTVNTYHRGDFDQLDIDPGPRRADRWVGFHPVIADFICANPDVVEHRKREIDDAEWQRTLDLGIAYLAQHPGKYRNGAPTESGKSATQH